MPIERLTPEETQAAWGTETEVITSLKVGDGVTISGDDHDHTPHNCRTLHRIYMTATRRGIKLSFKHSGDDLIVKRVE